MFESGSCKSHPEHITLYEALEASMDRENRKELVEAIAKSRKRRRDDQDPPLPPSKDSNQNKKKRQDSDTSASKYSFKQKTASQSEQPIEDVPIPYDVHILDSEDTDVDHLPKIKTRPDWLKPVPEEDRPETPEPDWVIPSNDVPKPENN
ncbi:hypothetical protein Tco_0116321 [Tanacetum coccineum]